MWAGIVGDNIIDPFYLPNSLTGAHYFNLLRSHLIRQLRKITRHRRRQIYFMHDSASPHFIRPVRELLTEIFGTRWIERRHAPHLWPPCSSDLTPLNFFFF